MKKAKARAIKLNAELQKVQVCLNNLISQLGQASSLLAEIIRENTPRPKAVDESCNQS